MEAKKRIDDPKRNPDPITKAPGAHPVGAGVGAAVGGAAVAGGAIAAGAAMGTVAGPVGTAVGAGIGAVAGGLIGKGVAEGINPTVEDAYWRENYSSRPYVTKGSSYDQYAPAYRYGWESRAQHADMDFDDIEPNLAKDWDRARGKSALKWDQAKLATRDAWERIDMDRDED
ncbi:MAG TPA: hypothetical protein VGF52_06035 [Tepidisphaeraceae bacterium]|jgi:hypothetical protein